ncbi:MAG TPA: hypothetical protein VGK29_04035 [Paludibaculum sp.]|jgi:hypothetical protein
MTNWEQLLGGYATGTLTAEERAALMQAALQDQVLFDALMDEEALRETLADPATRAALLRALAPPAEALPQTQAWWRNPWPWTGLGAVAAAAALFVVLRPANAPRPVQMAQNRPAATAPEPVPVLIETPKQLSLSQPETDRKPDVSARQTTPPSAAVSARRTIPSSPDAGAPPQSAAAPSEERGEPQKVAIAPPSPPAAAAPAVQAAEKSDFGSVRGKANAPAPARISATAAGPALLAKKKEALADGAGEALAVALSFQAEDGVWHAIELQSAIPARRPLRLRVTSARGGLLVLQPPLAATRAVLAGVPTEISLPGQPAGTLLLRLGLVSPTSQALGRVSNELKESNTRTADAMATLAPAPQTTREIRLRIE